MLAGVKFISRDQVEKVEDESSDSKRRKSSSRKEKHKRKKKTSSYSSDDDLERIKKGSRKSKKWYSSDEHSLSESDNDSKCSSERDKRKYMSQKKKRMRSNNEGSGDEGNRSPKKKSRSGRSHYSSEDFSSSCSEYECQNGRRDKRKRNRKRQGEEDIEGDSSDENKGFDSLKEKEIVRKEMGLEWMLRPAERTDRKPTVTVDKQPDEPPAEETPKVNPRELNPYLKDNGSGYPEHADGNKASGEQLLPSSLVGDGGASWRLKALKRAQEQAAREGRRFEKVVEERWGSLGQLAVSAASHRAAPSRAHLYAIKNRKKGQTEEHQADEEEQKERFTQKTSDRNYLKDVSLRNPKMRAPKAHDSLSWRKRKDQDTSTKDASTISAAISGLNKFANDGNFMLEFKRQSRKDHGSSIDLRPNDDGNVESDIVSPKSKVPTESIVMIKEELSANKVAAKAMQLRLKGKHEEAEKLLQEVQTMKANQGAIGNSTKHQDIGSSSRYVIHDLLEDGPSRKSRKKREGNDYKGAERAIAKRVLTQQERCLFCFENPNRPRHLVVAIANYTYLMLPQWQAVVPGHCCILPMRHESATRAIDDYEWDEIHNFKKCLIMMFAKQQKELVFLETVMGLEQQRRHCLIECLPLPQEIAKQAPLYFKKAIDEAEEEWSQHNAKKIIDTSVKGLRGSIPKNFPYFHVEFGLNKGFVHVIDDEKQFKSSLGLNVIRGMLRLPEEDMYRPRRHESVEAQKQAVADFARVWEPFDWTKQLE